MSAHDQPLWILDARRAVGRRIQSRRIERDLTQERLAELADLDRSTIQRLESGLNDPKLSQLLMVSRALSVHVTDLLA